MSGLIKSAYEACECNYTCGLPLRKCLRLLATVGMLSSIVHIAVGTYIIVHIIQTERVEWFPNSYYSVEREDEESAAGNGPKASRIVVPPPPAPPPNTVEDFEVHQHQQPLNPFQQNPIFPILGGGEKEEEPDDSESGSGTRLGERAIYYRRNVGLFICLAATLILINSIQLLTDICLFHSTFKAKRSTAFWVYFLLDIILWIMTLICFVTIFSGGGLFLLLVFLSGTAIRVYMVYVLHELMQDLRKPRAWSSTAGSTINPEHRMEAEVEEENNATSSPDLQPDDPDGDSTASSTKSLQPAQDEEEMDGETGADVVEASGELQTTADTKTEEEGDGEGGNEEEMNLREVDDEATGDDVEADAVEESVAGADEEENGVADNDAEGEGDVNDEPTAGNEDANDDPDEDGDNVIDEAEMEPENEDASPPDEEPDIEGPNDDDANLSENIEATEENRDTEEMSEDVPSEDLVNKNAENEGSDEVAAGEENEPAEENEQPAPGEEMSQEDETPVEASSEELQTETADETELPQDSEENKAEELEKIEDGNGEDPAPPEDDGAVPPKNESKKKRRKSKRKRKNNNNDNS